MKLRLGLLLATVIGLAVAAWVLASIGLGPILGAMARIGLWGFGLLCLWSVGVLLILGLAWYVVAPGEPPRRILTFAWSRAAREAATDVLPFSQLGGLVVGIRALEQGGVARAQVHASLIADLTTEMAAQLVFTLFGTALLVTTLAGNDAAAAVRPAACAGAGLAVAMMTAFAGFQRPAIALAGRLGERLLPGAAAGAAAVADRLAATYRRRGAVAAGFALNLLAWVASAAGGWLALSLMGIDISLWAVLVIESLIFTLRSVAFVLPGAVGVQEAAYVVLAPIFGLDPATAVALSLLKRGRDLALGVPTLAVWQWREGTTLLRR